MTVTCAMNESHITPPRVSLSLGCRSVPVAPNFVGCRDLETGRKNALHTWRLLCVPQWLFSLPVFDFGWKKTFDSSFLGCVYFRFYLLSAFEWLKEFHSFESTSPVRTVNKGGGGRSPARKKKRFALVSSSDVFTT